jgi:hypothetical protein
MEMLAQLLYESQQGQMPEMGRTTFEAGTGVQDGVYGPSTNLEAQPQAAPMQQDLSTEGASMVPEYSEIDDATQKEIFAQAMRMAGAAMLSAPLGQFSKGLGDATAAFTGTREQLRTSERDRLDERAEATSLGAYRKGMVGIGEKNAASRAAGGGDPQYEMRMMLIEGAETDEMKDLIRAEDDVSLRRRWKDSGEFNILMDHIDKLVEDGFDPALAQKAREVIAVGDLAGGRNLVTGRDQPSDYQPEEEGELPGFNNYAYNPKNPSEEMEAYKLHRTLPMDTKNPLARVIQISWASTPSLSEYMEVKIGGPITKADLKYLKVEEDWRKIMMQKFMEEQGITMTPVNK